MKRLIVSAAMMAAFAAFAAGERDTAVLHGDANRERAVEYALGDVKPLGVPVDPELDCFTGLGAAGS